MSSPAPRTSPQSLLPRAAVPVPGVAPAGPAPAVAVTLAARAALAALVLAVAALTMAAAQPAAAHEGPGILTVETDEPAPTGTGQHYVIRLVWQNDGHPAARDTTVTATPYAPDGTARTPVPLTPVDDEGRFEATVEMAQPGSWRVQFASVSPVATVDHPAEIAAPATTSSAPSTTAGTPAGDRTSEASGSAGAEDGQSLPDQPAAGEGDDGNSGVVVLVILALVVIGAAIAGYIVLRRRARATPGQQAGPASAGATAASTGGGRDEEGGSTTSPSDPSGPSGEEGTSTGDAITKVDS